MKYFFHILLSISLCFYLFSSQIIINVHAKTITNNQFAIVDTDPTVITPPIHTSKPSATENKPDSKTETPAGNTNTSSDTVTDQFDFSNYEYGFKINTDGKDKELLNMLAPYANRIINLLLMIAGLLATAMIVYNGFQLVSSGGNQDQIKKGKNGIVYAVIGLILALSAYLLINFIQQSLGINN